jgi:hypothetical protein
MPPSPVTSPAHAPAAPGYDPPAIAWEEDFEPVAGNTYCLEVDDVECQGGPVQGP